MKDHIVLAEPQCPGFVHSRVNAALLDTVLQAWPEAQVSFWGEADHLDWVQKLAEQSQVDGLQRVDWQSKPLAQRSQGAVRILRTEYSWADHVLRFGQAEEARLVLFASISNSGLLALKARLWRRNPGRPILAIPHAALASILDRQGRNFLRAATTLGQILRLPTPPALKYLALGPSIHAHLQAARPRLARRFAHFELPYSWVEDTPEQHPGGPIRFGFFGVSNRAKGFEPFFELATSLRATQPNAQFVHVGFITDENDSKRYTGTIEGITTQPLTTDEFDTRGRSITYAVWTGNPDHYRLTASATFLDTLSYIKPGIFLRNPYVEHYFALMGDIGYLCKNTQEMQDLLLSLAKDFPKARYRRQQQNILQGRTLFEAKTLGPKLHNLLEEFDYDRGAWQ